MKRYEKRFKKLQKPARSEGANGLENTITARVFPHHLSKKISAFICVHLWLIFFCFSTTAQTLAPGAPGKDAQWATAGKQGIGTSANLESKVWFTLAEGVMTEVYYPDVTVANVHLLQFVVVNPKTRKVETEQDDAIHEVKVSRPDSLTFQQINTAKSGEWKITKTYTIDPERDSILISVNYSGLTENEIYVYYDPSLNNRGMHDTAWTLSKTFLASDTDKSSALICAECSFGKMTNGFLGVSDGIEQIKNDGKILNEFSKAESGNVVQLAQINSAFNVEFSRFGVQMFQIVLSFGKTYQTALENAQLSAKKGFQKSQNEYEKGWSDYAKTLPKIEAKYQAQFNMAAMVLKAHEDKTRRGANIASLTIPWGGDKNANENTVGGYHLVWSRDLYQAATAFMALGDKAAAVRALEFLFDVQQKADGSFPQNSFLDGKPFWGSLQMDEVAFPLILAYQLEKNDKATWENHVKKAAGFIVKNGPTTPQERWEERSGYSPSTIAAEIAGLVCAAEIARKNGDAESAKLYLKTADEWQANIEKWTATTNGKYGDGNYYLRITQKGNPNAGDKIDLGNGAGMFDEREIVDAGFLELVRLGIKSPDDPLIQKSLKVIDEVIRVQTPNGAGFYRYNHDGYGEMDDGRRWNFDGKYTGKGRLWALLSGERGQYELAFANNGKWKMENGKLKDEIQNPKSKIQNQEMLIAAQKRLDSMAKFANEGLMIPEQIWDSPNVPKNIDKQFVPDLKFGEGTGSATPLAWSMAQFIRLAVNLQAGKNLDTPDVVYKRYVLDEKRAENLENRISDSNVRQNNAPLQNEKAANIQISKSPVISECQSKLIFDSCNKKTQMLACINYSEKFDSLEIAGDFTNWKPQKIGTINKKGEIVTRCLPFAKTARVEYKLIVDGKWITDPLNPNTVDNGVGGENSFFTMPDYQPTKWLEYQRTDIEKFYLPSKTEEIELQSKTFGNRRIKVYLPGGYDSPSKLNYPVLYLMDGTDYIERAKAILIQQTLVDAGKIKPFIMVFLDPKDRMKEYWASDDYAEFLATEVVPAIDKQYNTIKNRDGRAILGASLGGVTSVHAALKYPEIFGRVGGQSSSFWIDNERVIDELKTLDARKTSFRFYLDAGTLEGAADNQKAVGILKSKNFNVAYEQRETGHNWTAWRDRLADAFVALWGN